jgi:hypothetical protein
MRVGGTDAGDAVAEPIARVDGGEIRDTRVPGDADLDAVARADTPVAADVSFDAPDAPWCGDIQCPAPYVCTNNVCDLPDAGSTSRDAAATLGMSCTTNADCAGLVAFGGDPMCCSAMCTTTLDPIHCGLCATRCRPLETCYMPPGGTPICH